MKSFELPIIRERKDKYDTRCNRKETWNDSNL